jgi:hypothetical protein
MVGIMNWFSDNSPKRKAITKAEKYAVWNKYIGADKTEGKCYCCKQMTIHIMNFEVGHNKAVSKGGTNNISNYRPICSLCNKSMDTQSIEAYKKKLNPPPKKAIAKIPNTTKSVKRKATKTPIQKKKRKSSSNY